MLEKVEYRLPNGRQTDQDVTGPLSDLFTTIPRTNVDIDSLTITPLAPPKSRPVTQFTKSAEENVSVVLHTDLNINVQLEGLVVRSVGLSTEELDRISPQETNHRNVLTATDILKKFRGHIVRMDHSGVNLPASRISEGAFESVLDTLSKVSTLYDYPTGELWHFILPSSTSELKNDIESFPAGRGPKFEIVRDDLLRPPYYSLTSKQICLERQSKNFFQSPMESPYLDWSNFLGPFTWNIHGRILQFVLISGIIQTTPPTTGPLVSGLSLKEGDITIKPSGRVNSPLI